MMSESPIAADAESVDNMSLPGEWDNMSSGMPAGSPYHYDVPPHQPYNNMPPAGPAGVYDPGYAPPHMMDPGFQQQPSPIDPAYYQHQQAMYAPQPGMEYTQQPYAPPPQHLTQQQAFLPPGADPAATHNMQQQPPPPHSNQNSTYAPAGHQEPRS